MAFTQVTVTGTYKLADGSAADGSVRFTPRVPMHNENVVVAAPVTATLNGSGAFSVSLAATDDPGTLTADGGTATYRVELVLAGQPTRSYQIVLGYADTTRNLADIISVTPTLTAADWLTQTQADALYTSFDATLDDIADLTPANDDLIQRKAGTWTNRTPAQVRADMGVAANGSLNVMDFGAVGDGATNDTTAVAAAVDAAEAASATNGPTEVFFPAGDWRIDGTITHAPSVSFRGAGKTQTAINHTGSTWLFDCQNPSGGFGETYAGLKFQDITINAENAIRVNQSGNYASVFSQQRVILGVVIRNVNFWGTYDPDTDPLVNTTTVPTQSELETLGVGVRLTLCFNSIIEGCEFHFYGIGELLDGSDVSTTLMNRFTQNARHVHIYGHDTFGGKAGLFRNDILRHARVGGVAIVDANGSMVLDNFFESSGGQGQFLRSSGDSNTLFRGNLIHTSTSVQPSMSLAPSKANTIVDNHTNTDSGGAAHTVEVDAATNYDLSTPRQFYWSNNPGLNRPGEIWNGPPDPYVFAAGNIPDGSGGTALATYPFITSPDHGRAVLQTTTGNATPAFTLQVPGQQRFGIAYTGRSVGGGGSHTVSYTEGATTTSLTTGPLGFTVTTGVETITETVKLPAGSLGTGILNITLVNTQVEYERVEVVPEVIPITPTVLSRSVSGAVVVDLSVSDVQLLTMTGNITAFSFSNPGPDGQEVEIHFSQDGTGSRTVTGFAGTISLSGGAFTPTATANRTSVLRLRRAAGGFTEIGRVLDIP